MIYVSGCGNKQVDLELKHLDVKGNPKKPDVKSKKNDNNIKFKGSNKRIMISLNTIY